MSTSHPSSVTAEPYLPPELEREIFEIVAGEATSTISPLLRVCQRVHGWLEPLLYRVLYTGDWCSPLMLAIQTKSEGFLRNTVRHIFLDSALVSEPQKEFLSKCSGVVNLYVKGQSPPEFLLVCANTRLQRLGLVISPADSELPRSTFELPVFLSITHLDLILEDAPKTRRSGWQDWSALVALPALTHLCLSYFPRAVLLRVAGECSSLSVLVVTFWGSAIRRSAIALTQALATSDLRIVIMMVPNPRVDWATGARGGDDFWLRADAFIAKKRRGEIDESCYFLDDVR
ncbi:hypothetical protein C8R47DRAFT_1227177 [Mycena vitilis]|nr:hypothetical protein C8R47DRAFT_1227177 [Mycena vitilis]